MNYPWAGNPLNHTFRNDTAIPAYAAFAYVYWPRIVDCRVALVHDPLQRVKI